MSRSLVVVLLFVAVVAGADPTHALHADDLVGAWHTNETTFERMNNYDLEAGVPKQVITSKGSADEFVIVRRGHFLFMTTVGGKASDAIALSLKAGSNGELINDDDGMRLTFAAVGTKLRFENRLKGAGGGSVTGVYTRIAGFIGEGVPDPLQPIHVRSGWKEFRALVGLDRVIVDCQFRNPNGMPVMVHVVGQLITQNRGTRQDEDEVAIPAGATRDRVFEFKNVDLGRSGALNSNCAVTSPDGIPIESF
jgi:hypothetical protein